MGPFGVYPLSKRAIEREEQGYVDSTDPSAVCLLLKLTSSFYFRYIITLSTLGSLVATNGLTRTRWVKPGTNSKKPIVEMQGRYGYLMLAILSLWNYP